MRQLSTPGHGVAGIDHQIHQALVNLIRVRQHLVGSCAETRLHLDVRPHETFEHVYRFGNDVIQQHRLGMCHLHPAEGQQLAGEARGRFSRLVDLLRMLSRMDRPVGCISTPL